MSRLDEIKARADAATPGPWSAKGGFTSDPMIEVHRSPTCTWVTVADQSAGTRVTRIRTADVPRREMPPSYTSAEVVALCNALLNDQEDDE